MASGTFTEAFGVQSEVQLLAVYEHKYIGNIICSFLRSLRSCDLALAHT